MEIMGECAITRRLRTLSRFSTAVMAAAVVAMSAMSHGSPAAAQTLYTATTRGYMSPSGVVGRLYVVDPDTAGAKLVGPLRLGDGGAYVGANGLAVHPRTRILYGITAGVTPGIRPSLIKIDPRTAEVTLVGVLGHSASDICFDSSGKLFIWLTDLDQLGTVDLASGAATPVGSASIPGATGGGLAIDKRGIAHLTTSTAVGTLDTVDMRTGARTMGPVLSGAPYLSAIHSLTFSPSGVLYAVNTNLAVPAKAALVIIDPTSGVVALVGALPEDSNGLAFSPDAVAIGEDSKPTWRTDAAIVVAVLIGVVVVAVMVLRKRDR